jgi:hypothetical protein
MGCGPIPVRRRCCVVGSWLAASPGFGPGQIVRASTVNAVATRLGGGDLDGDLVVPAAEVLDERVPGDDDLRGVVGPQAAHGPESVFEVAVVGLEPGLS